MITKFTTANSERYFETCLKMKTDDSKGMTISGRNGTSVDLRSLILLASDQS